MSTKTDILADFKQTTETIPCETCGTPFESVNFGWVRMRHCDACVEAHDRRMHSLTSPSTGQPKQSNCVPEGYQDFDSNKLPDETRRLAASKIFCWQFGPRGIGIGGVSDLGKSYVIFELARRWQEQKRIAVIKDQDIARMVRENSKKRDVLLSEVDHCEILVWDDFGVAKMTDAVEGLYNDVLEKVNARNVPVFGTANYPGQALKEKWARQMNETTFLGDRGERIVRRFRDRCDLRVLRLEESP